MVDGDVKVEREYWDPVQSKMVLVNLTVRDHIFFDFLRKLENATLKAAKK